MGSGTLEVVHVSPYISSDLSLGPAFALSGCGRGAVLMWAPEVVILCSEVHSA